MIILKISCDKLNDQRSELYANLSISSYLTYSHRGKALLIILIHLTPINFRCFAFDRAIFKKSDPKILLPLQL